MRSRLGGALLLVIAGCSGPGRVEREAEARTTEGDALFNQGNYLAAIPVYEQVLRALPLHPRAQLQVGISWERLGMIDRAIQAYDSLLNGAAETPDAARARARRDRLAALRTWDPSRGPTPKEILD